jgi:hypothetical protein
MAHEVGAFLRCEEVDRDRDECDDLVEGAWPHARLFDRDCTAGGLCTAWFAHEV